MEYAIHKDAAVEIAKAWELPYVKAGMFVFVHEHTTKRVTRFAELAYEKDDAFYFMHGKWLIRAAQEDVLYWHAGQL